MRLLFELVCKRLQLSTLAEAMLERPRQEPVGQPGVPRKERPVEVRADGRADPNALQAALAVVAEARHDPTERLRVGVEPRDSGVVLETGQRPAHTRLELALQQAVADHAPFPGDRVQRKDCGTR
jgi:hypothetical protein